MSVSTNIGLINISWGVVGVGVGVGVGLGVGTNVELGVGVGVLIGPQLGHGDVVVVVVYGPLTQQGNSET